MAAEKSAAALFSLLPFFWYSIMRLLRHRLADYLPL